MGVHGYTYKVASSSALSALAAAGAGSETPGHGWWVGSCWHGVWVGGVSGWVGAGSVGGQNGLIQHSVVCT